MGVWRYWKHSGLSAERALVNSDICTGLQFIATMQLRTPLKVLQQHGYIHHDLRSPPPSFAQAEWQGIWVSKLRTFREMGIDMDEPSSGQMASSIGPIPLDGGDYLAFLISVRRIAESGSSINDRIKHLYDELARPIWGKFAGYPGHYSDEIRDYFFPTFLSTIPSLAISTATSMWDVGLDTPDRIAAATDAQLLEFKGIGPAMLGKIRRRCAEITSDRDAARLDRVNYE